MLYEPHRKSAADIVPLAKRPHWLCLSRQSYELLRSLQFSSGSTIIPSLVRCACLNPDCALIADEAKDTDPVDGIREIRSTIQLVPEDSQITAAVDSISIAASSNIYGKKTVLASNEHLANY